MTQVEERVALRKSKFLESLRDAYNRYSIVPYATDPRRFNADIDRELEFRQIAFSERIPSKWLTDPAHAADMYFYETGRAISIGEEEYIVRKIQEALPRASERINAPTEHDIGPTIRSIFDRFSERPRIRPSTLFAPIALMTPMMLWMDGPIPWYQVIDQRDSVMIRPGTYLDIIWSNNYVPFNDLFLLDKQEFSEWIFKSENETRLSASLEQHNSSFNMIAKTVFAFNLKNREAGYRVNLN